MVVPRMCAGHTHMSARVKHSLVVEIVLRASREAAAEAVFHALADAAEAGSADTNPLHGAMVRVLT